MPSLSKLANEESGEVPYKGLKEEVLPGEIELMEMGIKVKDVTETNHGSGEENVEPSSPKMPCLLSQLASKAIGVVPYKCLEEEVLPEEKEFMEKEIKIKEASKEIQENNEASKEDVGSVNKSKFTLKMSSNVPYKGLEEEVFPGKFANTACGEVPYNGLKEEFSPKEIEFMEKEMKIKEASKVNQADNEPAKENVGCVKIHASKMPCFLNKFANKASGDVDYKGLKEEVLPGEVELMEKQMTIKEAPKESNESSEEILLCVPSTSKMPCTSTKIANEAIGEDNKDTTGEVLPEEIERMEMGVKDEPSTESNGATKQKVCCCCKITKWDILVFVLYLLYVSAYCFLARYVETWNYNFF